MQVLINEQHPFVLLADNGFRDYYKPSDALFDACAAGRVLILSPGLMTLVSATSAAPTA